MIFSWIIKGIAAFIVPSFVSLTLGEDSYHVMRILKYCYGEGHVVRNLGLLTAASIELSAR